MWCGGVEATGPKRGSSGVLSWGGLMRMKGWVGQDGQAQLMNEGFRV